MHNHGHGLEQIGARQFRVLRDPREHRLTDRPVLPVLPVVH